MVVSLFFRFISLGLIIMVVLVKRVGIFFIILVYLKKEIVGCVLRKIIFGNIEKNNWVIFFWVCNFFVCKNW